MDHSHCSTLVYYDRSTKVAEDLWLTSSWCDHSDWEFTVVVPPPLQGRLVQALTQILNLFSLCTVSWWLILISKSWISNTEIQGGEGRRFWVYYRVYLLLWNRLSPKGNDFKATFIISVSECWESRQVNGILCFRASQSSVKVWAGAVVLSQGSTGKTPTSKVTHGCGLASLPQELLDWRLQFLTGC